MATNKKKTKAQIYGYRAVSTTLTNEEHAALQDIAKITDRSISYTVKHAITALLKAHGVEIPKRPRKNARAT